MARMLGPLVQPPVASRRAVSQPAIRAMTAANDIWNEAPVSDSGAASSTSTADQATSRSDSAARSSRMASSARGRHGAGALRRHRRAGERGVEQRHQQRDHGGDLLGIDAQRQRRHQRDAVAHQAHHQADDEDDVQARDRQDVGEARIAHRLGDVLVDRGLLAGQQRPRPRRLRGRARPS